jgi:hypothetical protein
MVILKFKNWFEMASSTLPIPIEIKGEKYRAIDMQFELDPPTLNREGKVMNQGSKFIARMPFTKDYLSYDGKGMADIISKKHALWLLKNNQYEKIPDNWWIKARFLD